MEAKVDIIGAGAYGPALGCLPADERSPRTEAYEMHTLPGGLCAGCAAIGKQRRAGRIRAIDATRPAAPELGSVAAEGGNKAQIPLR